MKYYTQHKITSFKDLEQIINKVHCSGKTIGFYFDCINIVRLFADYADDLKSISSKAVLETPTTKKFVKCVRERGAEKTERQKTKRLERFKNHLAKKGIEYNPIHERKQSNQAYDYYINARSLSNGYSYRLYIKNKITTRKGSSEFSSYGLSVNNSTLPLF